jgi:uncharacterized protein YlbG (UPF0298 family)
LTNAPSPNLTDRVKDGAGVAWSFTQLLLKKAPVAIDTNPVKIVFGIAQIALELKKVRVLSQRLKSSLLLKEHQGMQDNMDATERRIAALLDLILVVEKATRDWGGTSRDETRAMKAFETYVDMHRSCRLAIYLTHSSRTLSKELDNFQAIQKQSSARQFLVQEVDKQNIADIFERVNEARQNLIVRT